MIIENLDNNKLFIVYLLINILKEKNIRGYLVGGAVRDLTLGEKVRDIDIGLEEDPKIIIPYIENHLISFTYHEKFNTSTLHFKNGESIDLIRCRKEKYLNNGGLPIVQPSNIRDDLFRRDFTINAMAIDLLNGEIIDYHFGKEDLLNKRLKKIHENSYLEDPTRIFRAVKYAMRYGLEISDEDEIIQCIQNGAIDTLSVDRIVKEILMILEEDTWTEALCYLNELNIFKVNKELLGKPNTLESYDNILLRILNLFYSLEREEDKSILINNSIIPKEIKKGMGRYLYEKDIVEKLQLQNNNYNIYNILEKSTYIERVILLWNKKLKYKIINFEKNLNNSKILDENFIKSIKGKSGREINEIVKNIKKASLCTGIKGGNLKWL